MQLDCRNLACPEPVLRIKKALNDLKIGESLEILVNDIAPKKNIERFLKKNNLDADISINGDETTIKVVKTDDLQDESIEEYVCDTPTSTKSKVVFLNEEFCGSGDVGKVLLSKFLGAMLNLEQKPAKVICVNNAVFITTNRAHPSFEPLKKLSEAGTQILSCGSCLESYKLVDKLALGEISNAYEIMKILSKYEVIKL
ncbi:sulfurtransferase-like selenium metabolism protein YedF [Campylobacter sp. JMF_02 ED1]|uniref:sulfurtransferase-like selenium metabolism protein YedF n=1 Tax=unclassified Campylobacter TaxID=2593542 RepID=UPI0022E99F0A|nr:MULTISPECIES: sulfurtransferase-like selenium metabolism protein YedF [unclassified Campylobacter]MDA3050163.1 sulfurtransferase-like selenium metabolism protein YedF [Campylobacter sp. JMF_15 NE4]MDA3051594.1 sulfurtransferase-like selenium metabolism protein YedF [Campylobacter sp. JMF_02 ED1]